MRRRRHPQSEAGVTLFPFMAVLICTMGTLIVLLVIVVRQAKVRADTVARDQVDQHKAAAANESELQQRRMAQEDAQWQADMLAQSRDKTAADLNSNRLQLAHLEDHTRRLEDGLKLLVKQKQTLDALSQTRVLNHDTAEAELGKLKQRLQQERSALDETRREVADKPKSYAIIPYDGPNGTRRRPIYLECRSDRVVLQPEGIVLTASDFRRPMGPGNPLASSLRAIREYWARAGGSTGGDPYPLLIVRPDGSEAYGKCREAMESWDDEFGYELVSSDINLAFPPVDPALAKLVERTLDQARRYHNALVMAARARSGGGGGGPYLRAAPSGGGFVMEGGPEGFGTNGMERGGSGPGGASDAGGFGRNGQYDRNQSFGSGRHDNVGSNHGSPGQFGGSGAHAGRDRSGLGAEMGTPGQSGTPNGPSERSDVGVAEPSGGTFYGGRRPPAADQAGATGQPSHAFGAASEQGAGGGTCRTGNAESLPNMAELRGRNWALPHAARGATGAIRPIRVICTAQQLTIIPRRGSGEVLKTVPLRGSTIDALDEFVSALWQHIEEWGPAGTGMYWKPALHVEIAPGGQKRFEQLKHLLDGSGIEVRQKAR